MKRARLVLPVFVFLLTLAGCMSWSSRGMLNASNAVNKEFITRLVDDPDFAIIRGKPGISFEVCPQDASDNRYPTEAEHAAIKKFGMLMEEYFDKLMRENLFYARTAEEHAFLQRNQVQMDAHLQAVLALYEGKYTWAEYGQSCARIDAERMRAGEIAAQEVWEAWKARKAEREAQEALDSEWEALDSEREALEREQEKLSQKQKKSESKRPKSEDKGNKPEGKGQKSGDKSQKPKARKQRLDAALSPKERGEFLTPNA